MRGKPRIVGLEVAVPGITPAYAGKTQRKGANDR